MPPKSSSYDDVIVMADRCSSANMNIPTINNCTALTSSSIPEPNTNKVHQSSNGFRRRENIVLTNSAIDVGNESNMNHNSIKRSTSLRSMDSNFCEIDLEHAAEEVTLYHKSEPSETQQQQQRIHYESCCSSESSDQENVIHYNKTQSTSSSSILKLIFGASGIYIAYLFYGHMQEDLFLYTSSTSGDKFHHAWFLQAVESTIIVLLGIAMTRVSDSDIRSLPKRPFFQAGASQVLSKTFTSLALAAGLSFPVCMLAKSSKIVPVMIGQIVLGGSKKYTVRDYTFAMLLVAGTALLSINTGHGSSSGKSVSTTAGVLWILASLAMDGVTAGLQKRLLKETTHSPPSTLDFLLLTNISMGTIAWIVSILLPTRSTTITVSNELVDGVKFLYDNPECLKMVIILCSCSAVGQSFIFYVIAHFDPLVCSTITTTRKILSVLWSIVMKGHTVSMQGQIGILLAVGGLMLEVQGKAVESTGAHKQQGKGPVDCVNSIYMSSKQSQSNKHPKSSMKITSVSSAGGATCGTKPKLYTK